MDTDTLVSMFELCATVRKTVLDKRRTCVQFIQNLKLFEIVGWAIYRGYLMQVSLEI